MIISAAGSSCYIVPAFSEDCSFIHYSGYFYSASSSPLLLRGAADAARIGPTVSEFHAEAPQAIANEGLAQGSYVAARTDSNPHDPSDERQRIYQ